MRLSARFYESPHSFSDFWSLRIAWSMPLEWFPAQSKALDPSRHFAQERFLRFGGRSRGRVQSRGKLAYDEFGYVYLSINPAIFFLVTAIKRKFIIVIFKCTRSSSESIYCFGDILSFFFAPY